jgi:hypothetical protein
MQRAHMKGRKGSHGTRSGAAAGLAAVALLLQLVQPATGLAEVNDAQRMAVEQALRFRESSGFRADAAFVEATLTSGSEYDATRYGVPLSEAEETEIARRLDVQRRLGPAKDVAATLLGSAGYYIDQRAGGRPVSLFADIDPDQLDELRRAVPADIDFDVRAAKRTIDQLLAVQVAISDAVPDFQASGTRVVMVGIKPSLNQVVVGVHSASDQQVAAITSRFGDAVHVWNLPTAPELDACVSRADCTPMKGGLEIESRYNNEACTAGWIGKISGTSPLRLLTAGHCIQLNGGTGTTKYWYHDGVNFGTARNETWYSRSAADAGLLTVSLSSGRNLFYASVNTDIRGVTSSVPNSQIGEGDFVCRAGGRAATGAGMSRFHSRIGMWREC